jgi:hypothetical protein
MNKQQQQRESMKKAEIVVGSFCFMLLCFYHQLVNIISVISLAYSISHARSPPKR